MDEHPKAEEREGRVGGQAVARAHELLEGAG